MLCFIGCGKRNSYLWCLKSWFVSARHSVFDYSSLKKHFKHPLPSTGRIKCIRNEGSFRVGPTRWREGMKVCLLAKYLNRLSEDDTQLAMMNDKGLHFGRRSYPFLESVRVHLSRIASRRCMGSSLKLFISAQRDRNGSFFAVRTAL